MQIYCLTQLRSSLAPPPLTNSPTATGSCSNLLALPVVVTLLILLLQGSRYLARSWYLHWHEHRQADRLALHLRQIILLERIFSQSR